MPGNTKELQPDGSVTQRREKTVDMTKRRKRESDDAARVLGTTPIISIIRSAIAIRPLGMHRTWMQTANA